MEKLLPGDGQPRQTVYQFLSGPLLIGAKTPVFNCANPLNRDK